MSRPAFKKMKEEGKTSKAPLSESFGQWKNLKIVLLALFGLVMGQGVVWYTGQFYALFFLANVLKVDSATANIMVAVSLIIGTPFFVVFGTLSDKIGRKPIILAGLLLAVLTYFPLFNALTSAGQPRAGQGPGHRADQRQGRPEELLVPGQPDRP
jgi:Na+/melibiose symporter-like transporter